VPQEKGSPDKNGVNSLRLAEINLYPLKPRGEFHGNPLAALFVAVSDNSKRFRAYLSVA
jgi:hypothetical protein